jgi:Xaa-Pro aminopeptidase
MTFTEKTCQARRERLIEQINADLLIINNPRHIFYLTGLYVTPLALSGWGLNSLLINASNGQSKLIVHNFIESDAKSAHVDELDVWKWYDAATDAGVAIFPKALAELNQRLGDYNRKRVGIEYGWLPFGADIVEAVDITGTLLDMRRRKDAEELALIQAAIRAVEAGHVRAREFIQPGVTELDVFNAMYTAITTTAGRAVLPMGDFVGGERANAGGGMATPRTLQAGELMILDVFPVVNGYRADFTATLSVDGNLTDRQKLLETALHAGFAAGESMLKPGTRAGDVYRAVKEALSEYGFGDGFRHHAGHGLGLGHPEAPYFVPNSDEILVAGDVVTLEPGSYGADFGARIEHNYRITETGFVRLTNHPTAFA